ncbi:hypothetical protein NM688_g8212 [Phlebia brevispora]|uniref:Uncharacterized protein n=1 Tax=Phlebia brevispora TaxID=194682 RepID=A0ACC1RVV3_9APHY|nr:hypothetical protein NM688_g8212 [Phlebia brevispora]
MISAQTVLALAFIPLVFGQTNNTLGIEAIEAHFSNSGIVPTLLSSFDPSALLTVSYDGVGNLSPGQSLTKTQVGPTPNLQVTPANSTVQLNGTFTVVMADAGPVGTDESQGQTRHWLVNDVTLTGGSAPFNVSTDDGTAITEYAGPAPAQGSGAHRYVILLYSQPSSFEAPDGFDQPDIGVSVFNLTDYVQNSHLGSLVAGTYLTVEEGTATFTPSSTAPVITSTLPAAQSTSTSPSSSSTSSSSAPSATNAGKQSSGSETLLASSAKTFIAGLLGFLLL